VSRPTAAERRAIAAQIGRAPRGLETIVCRCRYGYPQVISVHPVVDGKPFPTTFWLTCPHLVRAVNRLEATGWIGRFEARIQRDPALAAAYEAAHRRAIAARDARLSSDERQALEDERRLASLLERGVGGLADRHRVKCLHMHLAQTLAEVAMGAEPGAVNPVGRETFALIATPNCDPTHPICAEADGSHAA
jgi:hypothetical protein